MPGSGKPSLVRLHRAPAGSAALDACDDDSLMLLAAGDHTRAFEVLTRRHLGVLTGYCAKFLGSARAGEEVAQDALVELWTRRSRYASGRFKIFLFTIARTRCLNRLRDDRRRGARAGPWDPATDGGAEVDAGRPDQLHELLERERVRRTREALLALAPKLREALLLRFDQGLSYAEIARVVHRPEVTVRSRVFHALRKLRHALGEEALP
jgi:RNA polymerase sigma-70 factor, ECF subfamily